jgi:hypothetical protein
MPAPARLACLLTSVLLLVVLLCFEGELRIMGHWLSLRGTTPEQQFWEWFTANSVRIKALDPERDHEHPLIAELERELTRVHPGLTWERDVKNGELVISADGNRRLFPVVQRLVAAAPSIPGWRIVAFRQRCSTDITLQYSNYIVRSADVWFRLQADGMKVGITLFLPHPREAEKDAIGHAAFLLLDAALGEYDVETKLGFVEWLPVPEQPASRGLQPYKELPGAVDHLYERLQSN